MTPFSTILSKYCKISFSEHDKGNRFERLMQAYLQTNPQYAYKFKKVWPWNKFPKGAIEWEMERYQIITHKESGIRNNPNDWAKDVGNPRYILDLL
jgi:predicted helicase